MSSSTIEKSVTIYRGDDEVLLFSGVGPVTGLVTLQVAAVFGGQTILQSTSVDGEHGADHAAGKLAFPITAGQSASLPADSMLAYDVKIVDAGVTRSPFYGVFRVAGSITQTEFPVGMSANDVLSLLSGSSDSGKGAGLIGVLQSFWSGVGFTGPFRLQGLLQWLYSKITPRIDPQTGGKLVKTIGTVGAIGESAVSESSGVLDAAGYLEGGNPFLGEHTTDELPEGSSNRYYTSARENAKADVDLTNVLNTDFYDKAVAAGAVGGGVSSFNSRTGAVTPQSGDYSASQISAAETGDLSGTTVQAQLEDLDSRVGSNLWGPYPGVDVSFKHGRRRSASPSFPWHPFSVDRVFTQTEAPDFFDELYANYMELSGHYEFDTDFASSSSFHILNTTRLSVDAQSGLTDFVSMLVDFAEANAYNFATKETPARSQTGTSNSGTDEITFSAAHHLQTGHRITGGGGGGVSAGVYYARAVSSTVITLHPTLADAEGNTNKKDYTSSASITIDTWIANADIVIGVNSSDSDLPSGNYRLVGITSTGGGNYEIDAETSEVVTGGDLTPAAKIRFYRNRVVDSTTTVKWHAIEDAALMSMRSDGSLANGLERLDEMQGHWHETWRNTYEGGSGSDSDQTNIAPTVKISDEITRSRAPISDGTNGTPRTGAITRPRSVIVEPYVYVGANTLS